VFAVLPQHLDAAIGAIAEPRGWIHLPDSASDRGPRWLRRH
jgi:hypothetical protein